MKTPGLARHLASDSPAAFARYAHEVDVRTLQYARAELLRSIGRPEAGLEAREKLLLPYLRRVTETLRDEFGIGYPARAYDAFLALTPGKRRECLAVVNRQLDVELNKKLSLAERARIHEDLIEAARPFARVIDVGDVYAPYVQFLPRMNREAELPARLEEAAGYALVYGDTAMACQFLGALGTCHAHNGDAVLMKAAWDRALVLARASHSWHEARIESFYAAYYRDIGEPARAVELLGHAEERCRELHADEAEIRFLWSRLTLFADLSCWDLVDRGLRRADVLLVAGAKKWSREEKSLWAARIMVLNMKLALARQDYRTALKDARAVVSLAGGHSPGPDRERLHLAAVDAFSRCGRIRDAKNLLRQTRQACATYSIGELLTECHLKNAELCLATADSAGAVDALRQFRSEAGPDTAASENWIRHDLLEARLSRQNDDRPAALAHLASALDRLERLCDALGASPEASLTLGRYHDLSTLYHEITAGDPVPGYRFALAWSELHFRKRHAGDPDGPAELARHALAGDRSRLPALPGGVIHCVFDWGPREVIRWTRCGSVVSRSVIPAAPEDLSERIGRVVDRIATAQAPVSDPSQIRELRELAGMLLPGPCLDPDDHRTLLVTRDGPLSRLPIEVLDTGSGAPRHPLLLDRDVAYVNGLDDGKPGASAHGLPPGGNEAIVVTAPTYGGDLTRRWAALNEPLPAGRTEAGQFAAVIPRTVLLSGDLASRNALLARWGSARWIYLAAHVVRDPELSYLARIPLAEGGDSDLVDAADILKSDLSHCDLVVLSACETGLRYTAGGAEIPGLGDLFATAGARAVVETGWSVKDLDGARVMHEFNDLYASDRNDPVGALCDARRRLIRQGVSPSVWAAYTILATPSVVGGNVPNTRETAWNPNR